MTDEPATESRSHEVEPNRALAWQAWSGGWLMGIGFGVLVMFLATELPNDFYGRANVPLAAAGLVALVWGVIRTRSSKVLRHWLYSRASTPLPEQRPS